MAKCLLGDPLLRSPMTKSVEELVRACIILVAASLLVLDGNGSSGNLFKQSVCTSFLEECSFFSARLHLLPQKVAPFKLSATINCYEHRPPLRTLDVL